MKPPFVSIDITSTAMDDAVRDLMAVPRLGVTGIALSKSHHRTKAVRLLLSKYNMSKAQARYFLHYLDFSNVENWRIPVATPAL